MARSPVANRIEPLAGEKLANKSVTIEAAPAASRVNLRGNPKGYEKTLGFAVPKKPKTSASKAGRHALWLGPDEWLVIDEKPGAVLMPKSSSKTFAAVDVSHRNAAAIISGPGAENVLAAGCPQNLSLETFPLGACSRTILGRAEVVLYRTAADTFRVEFWRSFAPYVWTFLSEAAKDAHI